MRVPMICAWCKKPMGITTTRWGKASHGICLRCMDLHFAGVRPRELPSGRVA